MNNKEIIAKLDAIESNLLAIKEILSSDKPNAPVQETPPPAGEKTISKEEVRKLLVAKSNADGGVHKPAVKALVKKYSTSGQLSDIAPEQYGAVLKELEAIGNA